MHGALYVPEQQIFLIVFAADEASVLFVPEIAAFQCYPDRIVEVGDPWHCLRILLGSFQVLR
ncbi:hypothetical protein SDC9_171881 [bioreactor metagenome]|uniref:Uncharacterized protein n=1 Tax=bioreactor metagenome TaxID=1076179 RepID=A0A645GEN9_9ZZZZ